MKRNVAFLSLIACLVANATAANADEPGFEYPAPQPLTAGHQVVTLFPSGHPALKRLVGFDEAENFDVAGGRVRSVTNIHNPSIEAYLADPERATGAAVVIAAGGGNKTCNVGPEGVDIARWFNDQGVSCFVHRYRLQPYASATDALADTKRAMRTVRARAEEWNLDPKNIGHIGFSAGGEQTARLAMTFDDGDPSAEDPVDRVSCRPDWIVLVYPGWTPGTMDLADVPKNVPPTFLVCAGTGDVFHAVQTVEFYSALFDVGRTMKPDPLNIELHIYGAGKHGGAISSRNGIPFGSWQDRLSEWAADLKLFPRAP